MELELSKRKSTNMINQKKDFVDNRIPTLQLMAICMAAFLAPLIAGKLAFIPSFVIQLLILTAAILWLVDSKQRKQIILPGKFVAIPLVGFALLLLVSVIFSVNRGLSIRSFINFISFLTVFFVITGYQHNKRFISYILLSLCASALIVGLIGLREYINTGSAGWRTFSTFFNPDFLAGYACLIFPILLAYYLSAVDTKAVIFYGLTLTIILANLIMTGSRLGFIAAVIGGIIFFITAIISKSIGKIQLIRLAILIIPLLIVFNYLSAPLTARMGSVEAVKAESHSGNFRLLTWNGTTRMAVKNPAIGTGIGTFEEAYPKYAIVGFTKLAHNSYLQIAAEAGILSLLLLIIALFGAAIASFRCLSHNKNDKISGLLFISNEKLLLCGLIAGIAASCARNVIDSDWYITAIGVTFWIAAGILFNLIDYKSALNYKRYSSIIVVPIILGVVVLMLTIGELWNQSAFTQFMAGNADDAQKSYKNAILYDPLNAEYHRKLAQVYFVKSNNELAEKEHKKSIKLAPSSAKNYYQLAKFYGALGSSEESIDCYKNSLIYDPNSLQTLLALAREHELIGDRSKAIDVYDRMLKIEESVYEKVKAMPEIIEPSYIFAHQAVGIDYELSGNRTDAMHHYELALKRIYDYQNSINELGEIMDAGGTRNRKMEEDVESARIEIEKRVELLTRSSRLS